VIERQPARDGRGQRKQGHWRAGSPFVGAAAEPWGVGHGAVGSRGRPSTAVVLPETSGGFPKQLSLWKFIFYNDNAAKAGTRPFLLPSGQSGLVESMSGTPVIPWKSCLSQGDVSDGKRTEDRLDGRNQTNKDRRRTKPGKHFSLYY
jgi:hypothetical protein